MKGWVVYNGNLGGKFFQHAELFRESAKRIGIELEVHPNNYLFSAVVGGSTHILGTGKTLPDFVLFWDKDIYLARHFEKLGVPVFNSSSMIETCDDKCLMYQSLSDHGIPIPKTIFAPKIFAYSGVKDIDGYHVVAEELGFPMIIKEAHGSFGSQVYLIRSIEEMIAKIQELESIPFLFQAFVSNSVGQDIRVQVVGDRVVAAMHRISQADFRANLGRGATAKPYEPSDEEAELAIRCVKILGGDFAGVDLLFGPDGPMLCEVNSNAHILNLMKVTGINAADFMMEHIYDKVTHL